MPHRGHDFSELCSRCDADAADHCPRCGEIFCDKHAPREPRRCDACETDFAAQLEALGEHGGSMFSPLLIATTAAGAGLAVAIGFFAAAAWVLGIGVMATLISAAGEMSDRRNPMLRASRHEVRELRAGFMAERSRLIGHGD